MKEYRKYAAAEATRLKAIGKPLPDELIRASSPRLLQSEGRKPSLLRHWHGPLTQDMVLHPTAFGRVPSHLKADAVTRTVCGFCSTGCGLDVHLRNGQALNLTANADYPVNLGMALRAPFLALFSLH